MPIVIHGRKPHLIDTGDDLTTMNILELACYADYVKACLTRLPDSPVLHAKLEAIEREVKWRAEDSKFNKRRRSRAMGA
jgi:hypothetical protein